MLKLIFFYLKHPTKELRQEFRIKEKLRKDLLYYEKLALFNYRANYNIKKR